MGNPVQAVAFSPQGRNFIMRIVINQITLNNLTLRQAAEEIAKAGIAGISVWSDKVMAEGIATSKAIIRDLGLEVSGVCLAGLFTQKGIEGVAGQIDASRRSIDMAAELGAGSIITVVGGLLPDSKSHDEARAVAFDALAVTLEHARGTGVVLSLESLHPMYSPDWSVISTLKDANDWCDRLGPGTSVAVDTYHVWWDKTAPAEIARAGAAAQLTDFHISDWLMQTESLLMDRGIPGEGVIDNAAWADHMIAAGHTGWVEVEIFSSRIWAMPPGQALSKIVAGCRTCLGDRVL